MSTILRTLRGIAAALALLVVGCTDATTGPDGKPWPDDVPQPPGIPTRQPGTIGVQYYHAGTCTDSIFVYLDGRLDSRRSARQWAWVELDGPQGTPRRFAVRRLGSTEIDYSFTVTRDTVIVMRCP